MRSKPVVPSFKRVCKNKPEIPTLSAPSAIHLAISNAFLIPPEAVKEKSAL